MKRIGHSVLGAIVLMVVKTGNVWAHGDVVPQAVDTTGLDPIGAEWVELNPYRANEKAIQIGKSAYGQNCARCHGLEAVSGGIAPDLRNLPNGDEGDEIFKMRVQNGSVRNGVTYMPAFDGVISQEGLWTIRAWLETISVETVEAQGAKPADAKTTAAPTESAPTTSATPAASTPASPAPTPAATETKPAETSTSTSSTTSTTPATSTDAKPTEASTSTSSTSTTPAATTTTTETKAAESTTTTTTTTEVKPVASTETKPAEKAQ